MDSVTQNIYLYLFIGWSPLHEAANRGHVNVARELLKSGAKVNMTGLDSVTALHDAAVNGHESMISLLLRYGADPSLKTATNKTALDLAVSPQVVRLLARHQSDSEEGITDENSPESMNHRNQTDTTWKTQKQQIPKSRRSLHLGECFLLYQSRQKKFRFFPLYQSLFGQCIYTF